MVGLLVTQNYIYDIIKMINGDIIMYNVTSNSYTMPKSLKGCTILSAIVSIIALGTGIGLFCASHNTNAKLDEANKIQLKAETASMPEIKTYTETEIKDLQQVYDELIFEINEETKKLSKIVENN